MKIAKTASEILEQLSYWSLNSPDGKVNEVYGKFGEIELFKQAYANLYANEGSMTRGVIEDTVDSMSIERITKIQEQLKTERYNPMPVKRVYIPKKSGGKRPLSIPTFTDKLVQEVARMMLNAIYEPIFLPTSHGFRPNRSCHTALVSLKRSFIGTKWFIEGDIKGCFDNIHHETLVNLLSRKINDGRFINLITKFLKAGYMENWEYNQTFSGAPQGGVISPILANIYLHQLDAFIGKLKSEYDCGKKRKNNSEYKKYVYKTYCMRGTIRDKVRMGDYNTANKVILPEIVKMKQEMQKLPSIDQFDPNYRRIQYIRYADDFVLGVIGSKEDAESIKKRIADFLLCELKLEMSESKTLITHNSQRAKFLGYEITIGQRKPSKHTNKKRSTVGQVKLLVPKEVIDDKIKEFAEKGKSKSRNGWTTLDDAEIMFTYDRRLRGLYNYYKLAENVACAFSKYYWYVKTSFLKTMARKYNSSVKKMLKKYYDANEKVVRVIVKVKDETRIYKMRHSFMRDSTPEAEQDVDLKRKIYYFTSGTELIKRLEASECELCGRKGIPLEGHHVKRVKDLRNDDQMTFWKKMMIAKNRKSLFVCQECHRKIHQTDKKGK
ncbi:MAG: reverse transcriptase domain-containing protein [Planctomycetota bacterium]